MRGLAAAAFCLAILSGCTQPEGLPGDTKSLPSVVPAERKAQFDMTEELQVATRACIASEISGPASLQALRGQGYTAIRVGSGVAYAKSAPKAKMLEFFKEVRVNDRSVKSPCTIQVNRVSGYSSFSAVTGALLADGFKQIPRQETGTVYAKGDVQLMLSGSTPPYTGFTDIEIYRLNKATEAR
ncbi:hypothetical protein [Paracoccus binzhouensis]|uniref:hypothetical protein n=1 Tax=Paracoccus binzhouensis TaxID=2796149 RepID=UPI0018EEED9B|nr:hypothetical protein [Paracoccus binzhouensis]